MARNMVKHGMADCVMVAGFEKMFPGSLQTFYKDREDPCGTSGKMMVETRGRTNAPGTAQMFGNAGREYMEKYSSPHRSIVEAKKLSQLTAAFPQIRRQRKRLRRNRPHKPSPLSQESLLPISGRVHPRPDPLLTHPPLTPHKTPMLPYVRRRRLRNRRLRRIPQRSSTSPLSSRTDSRPTPRHRPT